jgi:hypothetical protein
MEKNRGKRKISVRNKTKGNKIEKKDKYIR